MSAETYDGPRDYDSMAAFAKNHITKPICSIFKIENCDKKQTKLIEGLKSKSDEELEEIIGKVEAKVKEQEVEFDARVAGIQKQYDDLVEVFNKDLDKIKEEFNYKYVEQLLGKRHEEAKAAAGASGDGEEL